MLKPARLGLILLALALAPAAALAQVGPQPDMDVGIPSINTDSVAGVGLREPGARAEDLVGRPVCTVAGDKVGRLVGFSGGRAVIDVEDLYGGHLGRINVPAAMVGDDAGLPVVVLPLTSLAVRRAAGKAGG